MAAVIDQFMRRQLSDRRQRLERAVTRPDADARLRSLLAEVDAALERIDEGSFGICEICHESVECDRLIADPLVRVCLDHLSAEERGALERDLQLAAEVQRGLLPPCDVRLPGWRICYHYEPAGLVSGDYCDIIDQGEAGVYFMVGDVSGKGVAASMLMAHLHALFRSLISVGLPLKSIMEHASRVFCESSLPTHYATLVCGRAQGDGTIEICNAGHPPPLILRDGSVQPLDGAGLPVGIFCQEDFPVQEIRFSEGEAMLVYSDGVSEATGDDDLEYGVERICKLMNGRLCADPGALVETCRDDLAAFRGNRRGDDVTLFALSRAQTTGARAAA